MNFHHFLLSVVRTKCPMPPSGTIIVSSRRTCPVCTKDQNSTAPACMRRVTKRLKLFTALLHHVTIDLLRDSFGSLKRKAAPGVDGVTWPEYEAGLEDQFAD